ncbi:MULTISPECIES: cell division protein FtsL [Tissierellales]|jgi:cell division protein FtsL|uniref:Cell division protein FtsL n=1 Tax=Acidilutibacter cellobiosedens TaxID=2507161 RepID=A0A410QDM3_9FIRM|nr:MULTISPECIES: cell division protein FtsL [Tissierellales]MBE6081912.1 hypothetical protein [Tissierellaceae bacterium]QAT62090.1 hypothetical protein EQM13_11080 [Acidilutibacter cellobiosedens]
MNKLLVAKKEEKYYYGEDRVYENKVQREKRKAKRKAQTRNKLKLFLYAFIFLAACLSILFRYTQLTQMRVEISKLESEKNTLEKEKQEKLSELEEVKNSAKIEEDATAKLGMNYPTEAQIVYLDVNENKLKEEQKEDSNVAVKKYFKNILSAIINLF